MGSRDPGQALQELWDAIRGLNPTLARAQSERLLPEIEDILRVAPTIEEFASDSEATSTWLGSGERQPRYSAGTSCTCQRLVLP